MNQPSRLEAFVLALLTLAIAAVTLMIFVTDPQWRQYAAVLIIVSSGALFAFWLSDEAKL